MDTNTVIAIANEKGGTGKTTTAVSLSAALGEMGQKVLLVDLDGQAAASRWLGVEDDSRLAEALCKGKGLEPIPDVITGVSLAPASGKLDSVSHELRPTQGGQLRRVLSKITGFDFVIIDCPPSLSNRLIGNALLAATHVIVPVETSILALDGLRILLTTLEDIRDGFGHEIVLAGVLTCRYDGRTRLSRMVLDELRRALPGKVFQTVIRENVRMRECPGAGESILAFAPDSHAAEDYRTLAREILTPPQTWREANPAVTGDEDAEPGQGERFLVDDLRGNAAARIREGGWSATQSGRGTSPSDEDYPLETQGTSPLGIPSEHQPISQGETLPEKQSAVSESSDTKQEDRAGQETSDTLGTWVDRLAQAEQRLEEHGEDALPEGSEPRIAPSRDSDSPVSVEGGVTAGREGIRPGCERQASLKDDVSKPEPSIVGDNEIVIISEDVGDEDGVTTVRDEKQGALIGGQDDSPAGSENVESSDVSPSVSAGGPVRIDTPPSVEDSGDSLDPSATNPADETENRAKSKPAEEEYPALRSLLKKMARKQKTSGKDGDSSEDERGCKGPSWRETIGKQPETK